MVYYYLTTLFRTTSFAYFPTTLRKINYCQEHYHFITTSFLHVILSLLKVSKNSLSLWYSFGKQRFFVSNKILSRLLWTTLTLSPFYLFSISISDEKWKTFRCQEGWPTRFKNIVPIVTEIPLFNLTSRYCIYYYSEALQYCTQCL